MSMSIYSDLLAMSMQSAGEGPSETSDHVSRGEHATGGDHTTARLVHELVRYRSRLRQERAPGTILLGGVDMPSRIAREIDYDRALMRLCRLHGIACDPARFTTPAAERTRLEQALRSAGVDLFSLFSA